MSHRRFFSPVASVVASALLFAACGSADPLVLSLKSSQVKSGADRSNPSATQNAEDAKLAYAQDVSYSVLNELPDLGETGAAWSINPLKENKGTLKKFAIALGVPEEIVKEDKNNFSIGFDDKTGAGLRLFVDVSSAWWSYSSGLVATSTPPTNLPDEVTAIAQVKQLLQDADVRVKPYAFSATKTEWSTDVVGTLMARDVSSNISLYVSFGSDAKITYASGPLVELKNAGSYPLIPPKDAVKRLSQLQYGLVGPTARSAIDMSVSSPATDTSTPVAVTVPITGVRLALMQTTLTNNSSILLPAYTFTNADGEVGTVLAIEEKYLSYGDSEVTDGGDPEPEPEPKPEDPVPPAVVPGQAENPTKLAAMPDETSVKKLIGLTEVEAQKVATELGWQVRVAMRDGEAFMLTADYLTNRVNLTITKGSVTFVVVG